MKHTVELNHKELEEAIREYLSKHGHCLSDPVYGTPLEFELGELSSATSVSQKQSKQLQKSYVLWFNTTK